MDFWEFVDLLGVYFQMLWRSYTSAIHSGTAMGVLLAQATGLLLLVSAIYLLWSSWRKFRNRPEKRERELEALVHEYKALVKGKLMSAAERAEQIQIIAEDAITDALEKLYTKGEITLEEKDFIYQKIGKACKWEGLLTFAQASKKEQIKRKIDPSSPNYAYKPVKLPEPTAVKRITKFTGGLFNRLRKA